MAVKLYEIDSIRWNGKTIDYPQGKFLDNTADNILDGSYCSSLWANDLFGFHGAILKNAGVEPNGQVETASNSQVFDALKTIIRQDIESFGGIPSAVASGSADAITANFTEEVTLTNGMYVQVRAGAENKTTTPTFNPNNLGAKTIVKGNNQPLAVGDIAGAGQWLHLTYDATLQKWVLNNPATGVETVLPNASTSQKGIVQLTDTINDSTTTAITPNAVKAQFDKGKIEVVNEIPSSEATKTLYAKEVSEDFNEIPLPSLMPITDTLIVYVSANGNDTTADGSQSRPFRTLQACYDYIRNNYYFATGSNGVYIKFLTDYTETANYLNLYEVLNCSASDPKNSIIIDGIGHNVILNPINNYCGYINLQNITLRTNANCTFVLQSSYERGILLGDNCTINIEHDDKKIFSLRGYGMIQIGRTVNINLNNKNITGLVYAETCANFGCNFGGAPTINLVGDGTFTKCLLFANYASRIIIPNPITATGTITGKKYIINLNSILFLRGKGSGAVPGSIEGELLTGGQIG